MPSRRTTSMSTPWCMWPDEGACCRGIGPHVQMCGNAASVLLALHDSVAMHVVGATPSGAASWLLASRSAHCANMCEPIQQPGVEEAGVMGKQ